ncbi:MAG: dihydrofolate reductase [Planctomycetes bacterium]|nr:dihydrofolate reductase [Planctomycetota bacterium]
MTPPLALIAAMAKNRVIGNRGDLPWYEPEDLAHFKRTTSGHAVIMGRKTAESLKFRPLPKRRNLVVTRQSGLVLPGFEVFTDLNAVIAAARTSDPSPFIIGGGELYSLALPQITTMYLTVVDREYEGDAFFPGFNENDWQESERRVSGTLIFRTLVRR